MILTAATADPVSKNKRFRKGDMVAAFKAIGSTITRTHIKIDELMPQLTPEELKELSDWMTLELLRDPETTPEHRRELLGRFEKCPCCDRWLGHNNPPSDTDEPERFDR
jgi:hypothetical protein